MKTCLLVLLGLVALQNASARLWVFRSGKSLEADFVASTNSRIIVSKAGTNYTLEIGTLSEKDQAFVAQKSLSRTKVQLATEKDDMQKRGMVEVSVRTVDFYPEKVDGKRCWLDATFEGLTVHDYEIDNPAVMLRLVVYDNAGDRFEGCVVYKNDKSRLLVSAIDNLKRGDRVRLIGTMHRSYTQVNPFFPIDAIRIVEK